MNHVVNQLITGAVFTQLAVTPAHQDSDSDTGGLSLAADIAIYTVAGVGGLLFCLGLIVLGAKQEKTVSKVLGAMCFWRSEEADDEGINERLVWGNNAVVGNP